MVSRLGLLALILPASAEYSVALVVNNRGYVADAAKHARLLRDGLVEPLGADVVLATNFLCGLQKCTKVAPRNLRDADDLLLVWPSVFGRRVRALAVVGDPAGRKSARLPANVTRLPLPKECAAGHCPCCNVPERHAQYLFARAAFGLLVDAERARGAPYDGVVHHRADAALTPWDPAKVFAHLAAPAAPRVLHLKTEHVFWGGREAASVAFDLWDGMARWRDDAAVKAAEKGGTLVHPPVQLRALADSLRPLPPQAATKGDAWRFFTKTAAMPYPVDGEGAPATASCDNATGDVATMLAAVDAALARGCDRIDPLAARTAACRGLGLDFNRSA